MKGWIKTLRLPIVIMGGLLAIISFRISEWNIIGFLVAVFIIAAALATMAHNDWKDRFHDAKKGKNFALNNSNVLLRVVIFLWVIALFLLITLWIVNVSFGLLSILIIVSGLIYSEIRQIPLLPTILVAVTSASPVLYSIIISPSRSSYHLFVAIIFFMLGREILKDLDDQHIDVGYKWTLPVKIGARKSKLVAGMLIFFALVVGVYTSIKIYFVAPLMLISIVCLVTDKNHKFAKKTVDCAMALILLILLVSGT